MNGHQPSMLKPALISGVAFGVAGALPIVRYLNCCCCGLVVATGLCAALLYSQACRGEGAEFRAGQGALLGLLAGVVNGITSSLISSAWLVVRGVEEHTVEIERSSELLERIAIPPEVMDQVVRVLERSAELMSRFGPLLLIPLIFVVWIVVGMVFSTIGGLIGGALFKVER